MATRIKAKASRGSQHNGRKTCKRFHLQKPHGTVAPRVAEVGAEHFGIVCIDPAKYRSDWIMANFIGNVFVEPRSLPHRQGDFKAAVALIRHIAQQQNLRDMIVTVERTGNSHLPVQRAFTEAGFEVRIIHPFAVKQFRQAANPGNKTDPTDLAAQHRAAICGLGLLELPLDTEYRQLRALIRHRRDLVQKSSALCCQIREHLDLALPGYAACFDDLWENSVALPIARLADTPRDILDRGIEGMARALKQQHIRFQRRSLDNIIAWAEQAPAPDPDAPLRRRIWTELADDRQHKRLQIRDLEREIALLLAQTPYVLLMMIPGLNVVSVGDLAGEMGPIGHYANSNAITGRSGLFPSRSQSNQTDYADGPIVRCANRRLRGTLMQIADNLVICNHYFRGKAERDRSVGRGERDIRVRAAKRFSRIAYAIVAGRQLFAHPCCRPHNSLLQKLIDFANEHKMPPRDMNTLLEAAAGQLPRRDRIHEADVLTTQLQQLARRRTDPMTLGQLLPAIIARLTKQSDSEKTTTVVLD